MTGGSPSNQGGKTNQARRGHDGLDLKKQVEERKKAGMILWEKVRGGGGSWQGRKGERRRWGNQKRCITNAQGRRYLGNRYNRGGMFRLVKGFVRKRVELKKVKKRREEGGIFINRWKGFWQVVAEKIVSEGP